MLPDHHTYRVSWTDYHEHVVEAPSEEEALILAQENAFLGECPLECRQHVDEIIECLDGEEEPEEVS